MSTESHDANRVASILSRLGGPAVLLYIQPGEKKPLDPGWQEFGEEEMSSPEYLDRLSNGGNIGVLLGVRSGGLCSIDIDEDELVEEFLKHNPALRLTLRTRRLRGCNFWVWVDGHYPPLKPFHHSRMLNDKKKPLQIGEWRSTGGQTVIDGAVEGVIYQRDVDAEPIHINFADIVWPEWISDPPTFDDSASNSLTTSPPPAGVAGLGTSDGLDELKLENVVTHGNGSRHSACPACREDGEDGSGNHLFIKSDGKFGCCKYPADKEHRKRIWKLAGIPKAAPVAKVEQQSEKSPHDEKSLVFSLPPIKSADALVAENLEMPPEIINGFLHQGLKAALGSSSKARKTWILTDMAVSVATGLDFWRYTTVESRVLYINFEIPAVFFRSRLLAMYAARGVKQVPNLDVWNLRGYAAPLWKLLPEFIERLKQGNYALVIIDPIYKSLGGREENAAEDVAEVCNEMERMAVQTGCAVVYAHHFSKGNQSQKEAIDRISGSGVWARDADSLLIMTKHEEEDCYTIDTILRNLPEQPPFVVKWNYPLMIHEPYLDPENLKKAVGRKNEFDETVILAAISENILSNPISITEWAEKVNVPRRTLSNYAAKLRASGRIATLGEGNFSKQYITTKGKLFLER